ncbi:ester cyclase [Vreelandella titanicae]|uniref:ester cyclase n=1 Tax=Vreelandella titanicae TaxID=664683 RepID=UPI0037FB823D
MRALDIIQRLHDLWNSGAIADIPLVYSPSFVAHMPKGWAQSTFEGHAGARAMLLRIRTAFPDWREEILDTIETANKVVTRYRSSGINTGPLDDVLPTGRKIVVEEISIYRVADGLVQEQWCLVDDLAFARQLGLLQ